MLAAEIRFGFDETKLNDVHSILAFYVGSRDPVISRFVRLMPFGVVETVQIDELDLVVMSKN